MKVLITGGTGVLGRHLTRALEDKCFDIRIISRREHVAETASRVGWAKADLASGEGLRAAARGMETIIHLASDFRHPEVVDVAGTRHLIEASCAVGVSHFVYISIVGVDGIPVNYYRHKLEAEEIIKSSGLPYTILRATQFHSFVEAILDKAALIPLIMPIPTDFKFQSVDEAEVAERLVTCLVEGPRGRVADFGGPEVLTLGQMAETWMALKGICKKIIRLPIPGAAAAAVRVGRNTNLGGEMGETRWCEWLSRHMKLNQSGQ